MNIIALREPRIHIQHGRTLHRSTFQIPMINASLPTGYVWQQIRWVKQKNSVFSGIEFCIKNYHYILAILSIPPPSAEQFRGPPCLLFQVSRSFPKRQEVTTWSWLLTCIYWRRLGKSETVPLQRHSLIFWCCVLLNKHTGSFSLLLLHKLRSNLQTNGFLPKVKPAGKWSRTLLRSHKRLQCMIFKHKSKFVF